jgi:predicted dehydrogenase
MTLLNRRDVLKSSAGAAAGLAAYGSHLLSVSAVSPIVTSGAAERVRLGLIGCGGQGSGLGRSFSGLMPHAEIVGVCDPDTSRREQAKEKLGAVVCVSDFRKLLDDQTIDAVIVATPDHWHAPAAIMACDAGKHVYVEKPCSHNLREGRLLVEAARRNKVVVQHGTQSRSNPLIADAVQMLHEGVIGDVLMARAWDVQRRNNIGKKQQGPVPEGVDYDQWVGPAEMMPWQENRFHYNWHWWFNFGTGDTGNDGAHELDIARWGLGVDTHPSRITAVGGKYYHDDDQQFPDTQTAIFEYPGNGEFGARKQLIWEMRLWSTTYPYNVDSGVEFHGPEGRLFVSKRGKLELINGRNEKIPNPAPKNPRVLQPPHHHLDFVDAIRNGRSPNAEIAIGHLSASLCHLANAASRCGRTLQFDPVAETISGDAEASSLLTRRYREEGHWAIPKGVS